jgi:hypothetical protein
MADFKVGDAVLVTNHHDSFDPDGKMKQYIGNVYGIAREWRKHDKGGKMFILADHDGGELPVVSQNWRWKFHEDCLRRVPEKDHIFRKALVHTVAREICGMEDETQ